MDFYISEKYRHSVTDLFRCIFCLRSKVRERWVLALRSCKPFEFTNSSLWVLSSPHSVGFFLDIRFFIHELSVSLLSIYSRTNLFSIFSFFFRISYSLITKLFHSYFAKLHVMDIFEDMYVLRCDLTQKYHWIWATYPLK